MNHGQSLNIDNTNSCADLSDELRDTGFCILRNAVGIEALAEMRKTVIDHQDKMPNTRRAAHSRHLAGFDRFAEFKSLFEVFDGNHALNEFLECHFATDEFVSFGLSDITVNRSQHWHTDLLRGRYASYLLGIDPWSKCVGSCVKALLYLQDGKSLRLVPGSHLSRTPLDDNLLDGIAAKSKLKHISVSTGDIVMMDIRALHRGSTHEEMTCDSLLEEPKILVSNVYGETTSGLRIAMHAGNDHRLKDWDKANLGPLTSQLVRLSL